MSEESGEEIDEKMFTLFKEWVKESKCYRDRTFSIKDVITEFPEMSGARLIDMFASHGYTFQSYIRECRVHEAADIIKRSQGDMQYKEIFSKVGFSHYSSFARAFTAVMGVSPSKYSSDN